MSKISDDSKTERLCVCEHCLTWKQNGLHTLLHCIRKNGAPNVERVKCLCENCNVELRYNFAGKFFCIKDAAEQMIYTSVT